MRPVASLVTILVLIGTVVVLSTVTTPEIPPDVPAPEAFPEPAQLGTVTFSVSPDRLVVPLPAVVAPGAALSEPSVNVWGPVPATTPARVHSSVYAAPDRAAVLWITADASSRFRASASTGTAQVGDAPARLLRYGDATAIEWNAAGYGFRIVGWGVDLATLIGVAEGMRPPAVWSLITSEPPEPSVLPVGFDLITAASAPSGSDGPGVMGWSSRYRGEGETGVVVRITAAAGRPEPLSTLTALVPEAVVRVAGSDAIGFDVSDPSGARENPVRSRLMWGDATLMFEVTSATLDLADLVTALEFADLVDGAEAG